MTDAIPTGLAQWLAAPAAGGDLAAIASLWRDQDCSVILAPVAPVDAGIGAHLRRSYLGALASGASAAARAGQPCPWDPPCALDVFLREQLRSGGDGLPKPYVLFWHQQGPVLTVTLRVFGTACDWFPVAAEALVAGLSGILPWTKAVKGQRAAPELLARQTGITPWAEVPEGPLTLRLLSPMDDEGTRPADNRDIAARILSRTLRRVDALARWSGASLTEDAHRQLTAAAHDVQAQALRLTRGKTASPNRKGEARTRQVVTGEIDLPTIPADLRLLLAFAVRSHIGRGTNEGLGRIGIGQNARLIESRAAVAEKTE
ncbi:hypothetical protein [Stappia sp.]|uniref:hypothetical protein n=1 Tax=Stappia sp. TaxID=1870903 RepID=UPI003D0F8F21